MKEVSPMHVAVLQGTAETNRKAPSQAVQLKIPSSSRKFPPTENVYKLSIPAEEDWNARYKYDHDGDCEMIDVSQVMLDALKKMVVAPQTSVPRGITHKNITGGRKEPRQLDDPQLRAYQDKLQNNIAVKSSADRTKLMERFINVNGREYHVEGLLGSGGFGRCFLLVDRKRKEFYAMKEIERDKFNRDEVAILRSLQGSHYIINLYGIQKIDTLVRLFMEYAEGGNLKAFLQSRELCRGQILKFFEDLMLGVCLVHSKSIVHADIKPENILIILRQGEAPRAVLSDFGLSFSTKDKRCATMTARGTIQYRSPELCQTNMCNTFPSDIWACGCVLHKMHTGKPPWESAVAGGPKFLASKIAKAKEPPIPLCESVSLRWLYEATLCLQPKGRSTAREICILLEKLRLQDFQNEF